MENSRKFKLKIFVIVTLVGLLILWYLKGQEKLNVNDFSGHSGVNSNAWKSFYTPSFDESESPLCADRGKDTELMIVILSAPENEVYRLIIRQTWGFYRNYPNISIAFLIGVPKNETLEKKLREEDAVYNDVIRANFLEDYKNLTHKTVAMLEWVSKKCSYTKYLLKSDDDIYLNVPKALRFLEENRGKERRIFGYMHSNKSVIRDPTSKYFVSKSEYVDDIFPTYLNGPAYLITSDIIKELYIKAINTKFLKMEDIFITGIVASEGLGIQLVHENNFYFIPQEDDYDDPVLDILVEEFITLNVYNQARMYDLWKINFLTG